MTKTKMTTLKKLDLLDKLNRYDESISRLIDNADISKHILLPKWKIWLLLRIFGEKKCECDDSFASQALDLFDDALDWNKLPFDDQIAAYKNNENFIEAVTYYNRDLRKEIGSLNEILDQLSELVPNKVSVNTTEYFKDSKVIKLKCWGKFKQILGIEIGENCKTSISYFNKEVFPCKGLENENIMGPKWNRVMVSSIVAEIFRQIGVLDDDEIDQDTNAVEKTINKTKYRDCENSIKPLINELNDYDNELVEKIWTMSFGREEAMIKYKLYCLLRIFSNLSKDSIIQLINDIHKEYNYKSIFNIEKLIDELLGSKCSFSCLDLVLEKLSQYILDKNTSFSIHNNFREYFSIYCADNNLHTLKILLYKEGTICIEYPGFLEEIGESGIIDQLAWAGRNGITVSKGTCPLAEIVKDVFPYVQERREKIEQHKRSSNCTREQC